MNFALIHGPLVVKIPTLRYSLFGPQEFYSLLKPLLHWLFDYSGYHFLLRPITIKNNKAHLFS